MRWLTKLVDEIVKKYPKGDILIESGASPSGTYHFGHLREILISDAVLLELRQRGRQARHIQFVDDLDALRKIPVNIPPEYENYLGQPLCDIPAPDGSKRSYGDYFLAGFVGSAQNLGIEMELVYAHNKYRAGEMVLAIEKVLANLPAARQTLEEVSGRKLDEHWSPIQIMEEGRLKNRKFVSLDQNTKTLSYEDRDGQLQTVKYDSGLVKLDWRLDWPARWWLMKVGVEPFGRDHASAGGSFDTGERLMKDVYDAPAPIPVPYDFINRAGDTKKMSASKGTGIAADETVKVLPAEVLRYFVLSAPPEKRLYFDPVDGTTKLVDEFAALSAKTDLTEDEKHTLFICTRGNTDRIVSRVPFSHLVTSYQAALKDIDSTISVMKRTEHAEIVEADQDIIKNELKFIDAWLDHWAPEEVKFELAKNLPQTELSSEQKEFLKSLADKIEQLPEDADGERLHKAVYECREASPLSPKELFTTLYQLLINKDAGPRAGWFLAILPRGWLLNRLRLKS